MRSKKVLFLLFLIGFLNCSFAQNPAARMPDFTLFTLDGTPFTIKQIPSGKATVFIFFDVTCSHCRVMMRSLSDHYQDLKYRAIFLVSLDRKDAILPFLKNYGSGFLTKSNVVILQDLKYEFIPKFQPLKYPSVFLYDKNKRLELYEHDEKQMPKLIAKAKINQK